MAKGALQDALFHSCNDDFLPGGGFLMFVCIEGSICHIYAHGTSPEQVIVNSAEIQHPEAKAPFPCDLDPKLVLGDF